MISDLNHNLFYARERGGVALTLRGAARFVARMKNRALFFFFLGWLALSPSAPAADEYRQLQKVNRLPEERDRDFEFRKTKIFFLGQAPTQKGRRVASVTGGVQRDPSVGFEGTYRLFGAVTLLDQQRRWGHYFDFFWRGKRDAEVTVRLEYQQEKLRSFTQAREVVYPHARGHHKTSFTILGEDFFNDGRVIAWRCLLIKDGKIVAQDRSFLWRDAPE